MITKENLSSELTLCPLPDESCIYRVLDNHDLWHSNRESTHSLPRTPSIYPAMNTQFRLSSKLSIAVSFFLGLSLLGGVAFAEPGSSKTRKTRVHIDSVATKEYSERQKQQGPDAVETYSFYKGQFFQGSVKDRSLERVEFQNVIDQLTDDMRKQNYLPATDTESGDLLIVVHYGVTSVDEDWEDLMGITTIESDETGMSEDGDFEFDNTMDQTDAWEYDTLRSQKGKTSHSNLLGVDRALRDNSLSNDERHTLHEILEEERYFIVLMAYDWQKIRQDKELKLLWSTRFSMRSPGTNFEEAYYSLSRAAAPYFGTHLDKLTKELTHKGAGKGTVGELEIIEVITGEE